MRPTSRSAILAAAVLAFGALAAQAAGSHDRPGPNGGRIADAGPWHAELVTGDATVTVYLSDKSGKPVSVSGFTGTAILVAGGKTARIPLAPEGNRLAGKATGSLGERPTAAIRLTAPDGASASARFD